jgi:4-hydroxybenzoate-CoA ligase
MNGNAVDHFIDRHARTGGGDRPAFIDPARGLTYAQLQTETARFAAALRAAGIGRERRIALVIQDTVEFPVVFWGAIRAGVVPVPINTLLTPPLIAAILADCRAEAVFVSPALRPAVSHPRVIDDIAAFIAGHDPALTLADCPADEVAFWLYSSGSTGAAKGVRHVHASLRATADTYAAQVLGIRPDDRVFSAAKLFFAYGLGNAMTFPLSVGAASVLLPDRPTPDAVLAILRDHAPTIFCGVPTLFAALLAHPAIGPGAGSPRLRVCTSAGEALPEQVGLRWRATVGVDILDGLGSTEMLHIFLSNRPGAIRYGTTGQPVPGYEALIVDESGHTVAPGEPGELVVRGPSAAEGYWNQREKTRKTFRGEWTHTGDTYLQDEDGTFRYCGRRDDMLKVGGIWVSPFEVEDALISHPAVLEAAVIGHQDSDGLVKPKAYVVLQEAARAQPAAQIAEALKAQVKDRIGPWKYPRWIEIVDTLPKTATGKIQRFLLRDADRP